jgi:hypothetical protein
VSKTIQDSLLVALKAVNVDARRKAFNEVGTKVDEILAFALELFGQPFFGETITKEPIRFGSGFRKGPPIWRTARIRVGGIAIAVTAAEDEDAGKAPGLWLEVNVSPVRRGPGTLLENQETTCDALRGFCTSPAGWFLLRQARNPTPTLQWARLLEAGVYLARSNGKGTALTVDEAAIKKLADLSRPLLLACVAEYRTHHQKAFARLNALVPQGADTTSATSNGDILVERQEVVDALIGAMSRRPLVLLAGVSGSGKTQIACRIAWGRAYRNFALLTSEPGSKPLVQRTRELLTEAGVLTAPDAKGWVTILPVDETARGLTESPTEQHEDDEEASDGEEDDEETADVGGVGRDADGADEEFDDTGEDADESESPASGVEWSTPWELVSVRPDWHEAASLWGWPEKDHFHGTRALRVVLHAWLEWQRTKTRVSHVLVLDEMNLSRLEYYGSDLLSAMERQGDDVIALHDTGKSIPLAGFPHVLVPERIGWPPGLCVVGTVNVDETTFAFAPKVLDRAAVLEFLEVDLERAFQAWGRVDEWNALTTWFTAVQEVLRPHALHLGYRAAKEIADTLVAHLGSVAQWSALTPGSSLCAALDRQLLSKVLPRVRGPRGTSEPVLREILVLAIAGVDADARKACRQQLPAPDDPVAFDRGKLEEQGAKGVFPTAARKTLIMLERLEGVGFTSFF